MRARGLMVQGTASFVGKSLLVTGLCRLLARRGIRVAPFKAQNMSLNSGATPDGCEIGRAQMLQAEAAGLVPHVDLNPVLLKPGGPGRCQVVLKGKIWGELPAAGSSRFLREAWDAIQEAYARLAARYEVVVIEGAGSPAEINLWERDLANMRVAHLADAPVLVVADLDRGGAFAALLGTWALLPARDRSRLRGFILNKLRGEAQGLEPAIARLEGDTGVRVIGVLPWLADLALDEEDGVALEIQADQSQQAPGKVRVGVLRLPAIANFTDLAPLERDARFAVRYVDRPADLEGQDVLILPGSKSTVDDLTWLRGRGLDVALHRARAGGARLVGICGGYQMLGRWVTDPEGVEGSVQEAPGLGYLDVQTVMERQKIVWPVVARPCPGGPLAGLGEVSGYEIHMGVSTVGPDSLPLLHVRRPDGSELEDGTFTPDGLVWGTSLHGLFEHAAVRHRLFDPSASHRSAGLAEEAGEWRQRSIDRLADTLERHLDLTALLGLVGRP